MAISVMVMLSVIVISAQYLSQFNGPSQADRKLAILSSSSAKQLTFDVTDRYPSNPRWFTQGLAWDGESLYLSAGQRGKSSLNQFIPGSLQATLTSQAIDKKLFAEDIAVVGDSIMMLTYQSQQAILFNKQNFSEKKRFSYTGEGWGLTYNGEYFIRSDGSNTLTFHDAETFAVVKQKKVTLDGKPVNRLNALAMVDGRVFANHWQSSFIFIIEPRTGEVIAWMDCQSLVDEAREILRKTPASGSRPVIGVLNGITWQAEQQRLLVTGKNWPIIYQIRFSPFSTS